MFSEKSTEMLRVRISVCILLEEVPFQMIKEVYLNNERSMFTMKTTICDNITYI